MSTEYDQYLIEHKANVMKGFNWLLSKMPHIFCDEAFKSEVMYNVMFKHDQSKYDREEYEAYDAYFYGNPEKTKEEIEDQFKYAWLRHIHNNPHHWQHWVLINDEPEEGMKVLDMPDVYIIEMICDWWSFSWKKNNLIEIFDWYDEHKNTMKLSQYTRNKVEEILEDMKLELANYPHDEENA